MSTSNDIKQAVIQEDKWKTSSYLCMGNPLENARSRILSEYTSGVLDWSKVSSERATGRKSSGDGAAETARLDDYGSLETQGCKLGRPWRVGP